MTLNLAGKNPYTGLLSKFSPQFQQFVKELGDAKSKGVSICVFSIIICMYIVAMEIK